MRQAKDIKILIACEESQTIATAFRKLGFQAYSCDLKECSGGHPEYHIQGDCLDIINRMKFDLIIAHPPCTYLSVAGARWFSNPERKPLQEEAVEFFLQFTRLECDHVAIENPIGIMSTRFRKPDQIIQPFQFGDSFRKSTCLWLKGLPKLKPTNIVDEGEQITFASGKKMPKWYADLWGMSKEQRQELRSKTFPGIASAIAEQWGTYLLEGEKLYGRH